MIARIVPAVFAGSLIVGVVGVTPAGATPPGSWSKQVCTSLTDWSGDIGRLSTDLAPPDRATPEAVKAAFVKFLQQAVDATESLIDDVESAGTPAVDHGKAIAAAVVRGVRRAREILVDAEDDARHLPTGDRQKFQARGRAIQRALDRGGREVQGVFNAAQSRYDVPELNRAFDREPACRGLGS